MISKIKSSSLFFGMTEEEIKNCLACSNAQVRDFKKDEFIFYEEDEPKELLMLVEGAVSVGNNTDDGRRVIVATFDKPGELFGEVFVFLKKNGYDYYAQAATDVKILTIPKVFFFHTCAKDCDFHAKLISNMLSILASKAYLLNKKLQILSSGTLRQKIAKVILQNLTPEGKVKLNMNREELADYLNTARPSLSRELMNMQKDGLIQVVGKDIYIKNLRELKNI
ncbi:MAG: Crp/Fnr family transcriptional regulator [Clostridiaceae bacterium]|nr:Crp/Fnr family transcriptional regulator [Clostridiaceae bacterium]